MFRRNKLKIKNEQLKIVVCVAWQHFYNIKKIVFCHFHTFCADAKAPIFAKQGAESIVRTIVKVTLFLLRFFLKKMKRVPTPHVT